MKYTTLWAVLATVLVLGPAVALFDGLPQDADAAVLLKAQTVKEYVGLSSDTKPTLAARDAGATFTESDKARVYLWSGSAWGLFGSPHTTAGPDTLTAAGSTNAIYAGGYYGYTTLVDVADVNTNIIVYVEGKLEDTGWCSLPAVGDSTTVSTNGSFGWFGTAIVDSLRFTVSAGSGDTAFSAIIRWLLGGQ